MLDKCQLIYYKSTMYNNINLISKQKPYKNLTVWDFSRELRILDKFNRKGNKKMSEKENGVSAPLGRRERFKKYRENRVKKAVRSIKHCENMANKNSYEYEKDEADIIIKALEEAVRSMKYAFSSAIKRGKEKKDNKYF